MFQCRPVTYNTYTVDLEQVFVVGLVMEWKCESWWNEFGKMEIAFFSE